MKRRMCLLIVAAVLAIVGQSSGGMAQAQYTISQLREQAAQGWRETYTDKYGRTTKVDIDVEVFGDDVAPVITVKPSKMTIDLNLLEEDTVVQGRTLYRSNPADDIFGAKSGQVTMTVHHTYGEKIDMDMVYGQEFGAPLTMRGLELRAKEILAPQGISLDSFLFDQPKEFSVRCKMKRATQEVIAPAAYLAHFWQTIYGMPIFEHINRTYIKQDWPEFAPQVQISMRSEEEYSITLWNVEETEILAQDIPLASFETIRRSAEEKIESGHVQKVYSMRLGYVVYNKEGYPKDMPTIFDAECYYLVPTWVVECIWMDNPKKDYAPGGKASDELAANEKDDAGYYMMMIDAQTGDVFDRNDRSMKGCGDSVYRGFIPWDDVR